jgi:hypothetical protein
MIADALRGFARGGARFIVASLIYRNVESRIGLKRGMIEGSAGLSNLRGFDGQSAVLIVSNDVIGQMLRFGNSMGRRVLRYCVALAG